MVLAAVILFVPFKLHVRDGGSKVYKALTYKVYKYHRINAVEPYESDDEMIAAGLEPFLKGTRVEILGIGVYDDYNDIYSEDGEVYLKDSGNYIPYFKFLFRIIKERLTKDTAAETALVFAA